MGKSTKALESTPQDDVEVIDMPADMKADETLVNDAELENGDTILVKEREWVSAGQQIATMGDSGTNSVKLHFEVRYRGKSLDPMKYLPALK